MKTITASAARRHWASALGRVEHANERIAIVRHKQAIAALIPYRDLELLDILEDEVDIAEARLAIGAAQGTKLECWADIKRFGGVEL